MITTEFQYIQTKTILSKLRQPDPYFGISYNINLYHGCQHGCIYCDTRSDCYRVGDISKISVKKNALDLLPKELSSKRKNKGTIGTGSMNDPYMPIERKLETTRKALGIISDYKFPIHVITKSSLVARDIDILKEISGTYAAVSLTITTADDALTRKIEPYAPLTSQRFETMQLLAKNGIYTGVTMLPILPYINDNAKNIETILRLARDAGASYVIPMFGVTLRNGSREYFYKSLDKSFPLLKQKYISHFGNQYECFSPNYRHLNHVFQKNIDILGLSSKMEFYKPNNNKQLSLF